MKSNPTIAKVLAAFDRGATVPMIAAALDVSDGYVFRLLRIHRPNRQRWRQPRRSALRAEIERYLKAGIERRRVRKMFASRCSKQFVYKVSSEIT